MQNPTIMIHKLTNQIHLHTKRIHHILNLLMFKNIANGVYKIWFKKSGWKDAFVNVAVTKGNRAEVSVVMEKI